MKFIESEPTTWRELQDRVCALLNECGYNAQSPKTIETVRGKVEVDVFIESPDELVKKIICECKYWESAVPKEKVHAFRTVVADAGASLGLLISKCGFQSGAVEAAKYSNIVLLTWDEFVELLKNKWIINQLKSIKKESAPLSVYLDPLDFPYEQLRENEKKTYVELCEKYMQLRKTCWMITKTDLLEDNITDKWYHILHYSSIEAYINFLKSNVQSALSDFQQLIKSSNISLPEEKFENLDGYTYMFLQ